ncbi:MAG: hypothetical protein MIO92_14230 [Methanosarcinaceae archaeon]|nr:hypothetical protein [Methanosarcinaceae archaeon]
MCRARHRVTRASDVLRACGAILAKFAKAVIRRQFKKETEMRIIKNIIRRLNPTLAPAGVAKMPPGAKEGHSTGLSAADRCQSCYTCESGIIPTVTPSEFREATKDGKPIPDEWFTSADQCGICVSCEKCFSGQD